MPQCTAPRCSFFAPDGGVYCSKHFNQLATPEEKAEQQRKLTEGKQQIEDARLAFNAVLEGPVEAAKAAWPAVCAMPGFRASWVADEIMRCTRVGATNLRALWRLEEGDYVLDGQQVFQRDGLRPLMAFLDLIVRQNGMLGSANSPLLNVVLEHPSIVPWSAESNPNGSIPASVVTSALYGLYRVTGPNAKLAVIQRLLPFVKIDKTLIDQARYTCKKPANAPTPEKLAIVKLIEDTAKERRAAVSHEQRAQEEATRAAAKAAEAAALEDALADTSCRFVAQVQVDGIPQRLDVWTCGAYSTRCRHVNAAPLADGDDSGAAADAADAVVVDHRAHATCPQIQGLRRRCVRATLSARRWQPAHQTQKAAYDPWLCFPIHREALETQFGFTAEQLASLTPAEVVSSIGEGIPVRTPAQRKRSRPTGRADPRAGYDFSEDLVLVKKLWAPATDAIWFHPRWYSGFGETAAAGLDGDVDDADASAGVDRELAALCTATTRAFQATLPPNTVGTQLVAYHISMDVYSPTLLLVGPARDAADGDDDGDCDGGDAVSAAADEAAATPASAAPGGPGGAAPKTRGKGGKAAAAAAVKEPRGVEHGVVLLCYVDSCQTHYEGGSN